MHCVSKANENTKGRIASGRDLHVNCELLQIRTVPYRHEGVVWVGAERGSLWEVVRWRRQISSGGFSRWSKFNHLGVNSPRANL